MPGRGTPRDPGLLDAIDAFDRVGYAGETWRVIRNGRDPVQASASGGRWDLTLFDGQTATSNDLDEHAGRAARKDSGAVVDCRPGASASVVRASGRTSGEPNGSRAAQTREGSISLFEHVSDGERIWNPAVIDPRSRDFPGSEVSAPRCMRLACAPAFLRARRPGGGIFRSAPALRR
jgi:hypothetical protein